MLRDREGLGGGGGGKDKAARAAVEPPRGGRGGYARVHTGHSRVLEKYNFLQYENLKSKLL
jgi:hypothetical protein